MLFWKLWTVYTSMFAVTAILSCVINIRGLFKSTKCGRLKMSNLKLSQPGVRSFERSSPSNFRTQGSFSHINSGKIFERDLLSSDSVAKSATQKPWVF